MYIHKDFLLKIWFFFISIFSILVVKASLRLFSFNIAINKIKKISNFLFSSKKPKVSIHRAYFWYLKLNNFMKIKSCLVNSLSQKIIFSLYGYDVLVVCGIKMDKESNLNGHAWLTYENKIIFEEQDILNDYTVSFIV